MDEINTFFTHTTNNISGNLYLGNLSDEFYNFVVKFAGLHCKNKSWVEIPHEDRPPRKKSKHQIKVDNNPH